MCSSDLIKFNTSLIRYPQEWGKTLKVNKKLDTGVASLKMYPGLTQTVMDAVIDTPGIRGLIVETFGSGNAPTSKWFTDAVKRAVAKGLVVLNVTQCQAGSVDMDAYATGIALKNEGVISGYDSTIEAAITKMFYVLGQTDDLSEAKILLNSNLRGEISI